MKKIATTLVSVCLLAACANAPKQAVHAKTFAILDFTKTVATDQNIAKAALLGLDGKTFLDGRDVEHVFPGFHYARVISSRFGSKARLESLPFAIEAKPCVRYFIAALHPIRQTPKQWKVVVIGEEPITRCEMPAAVTKE